MSVYHIQIAECQTKKKKILKKAGGENYLTHGKARIELHQISLFRNQANEWNGTFRVLKEKSTNA